jgi:hypothetical protein
MVTAAADRRTCPTRTNQGARACGYDFHEPGVSGTLPVKQAGPGTAA